MRSNYFFSDFKKKKYRFSPKTYYKKNKLVKNKKKINFQK